MSFCPYCKEIVGSNVTECPSCGMSWNSAQPPGEQPTQGRTLPRVTAEEPLPPPPQQPAYQPQYQQLPQQPAYQQQYQQPPQQPAYQPPPQYQPQPQQPAYQPQPQYGAQPQYQQPYAAPAYAAHGRKVGGGQMALAMVGGIMGIVAAFMLFYYSDTITGSELISIKDFLDITDDYLYAWLIPVFGILAMLFAIIAFAAQNKAMGALAGVFGILLLLLPVVLAFHISSDMDIFIGDVFYSASFMDTDTLWIYIGGIMAMLGGILAMAGGFGLAKRLSRVRRPAQPRYY